VLRHVALQTWVRIMEGRGAGRGGLALRLPVVSTGRARPRAWRVRQGPTGHVPADRPSALVERGSGLRPEDAQGGCLGEGACAGTRRPHTGAGDGWSSVCRTGCHRTAWWDGAPLRRDPLGAWRTPGPRIALSEAWLTRADDGPRMRIGCGAKAEKAPRSVVSTRAAAEEACRF